MPSHIKASSRRPHRRSGEGGRMVLGRLQGISSSIAPPASAQHRFELHRPRARR